MHANMDSPSIEELTNDISAINFFEESNDDHQSPKTDQLSTPSHKPQIIKLTYDSKKPKWWKTVAGKPTKGQKKAMQSILSTNRLPKAPYGTFLNWKEIFPNTSNIWYEIGFGYGENLLALAHRKHTENICFVGAEIHKQGIATLCRRMKEGFETDKYWTSYELFSDGEENTNIDQNDIINPYENIRIHPGDGIKLLPHIPSSSLSTILITFPDPFPKNNQKHWRIIQTSTVLELHRVLRESGHLFLATDHDGFCDWTHTVINLINEENGLLLRKVDPCPDRTDWLPIVSKYERKGWDEGRKTNLSCWMKV